MRTFTVQLRNILIFKAMKESVILKAGQVVMFHTPLCKSEETLQMEVVEDRGNRVLVYDTSNNLPLRGTTVDYKSDLKLYKIWQNIRSERNTATISLR